MSLLDVLIVGGGAAGIAAARRLHGSDLSVLLVEAGDRLGGRACTRTLAGLPLDLGCGWLHSADRNPWRALAEGQGWAIDRTPPAWQEQYADLGFSKAEQREAAAAFEAFDRRLREQPPASDRAADALDPGCRWNDYLEAVSGYINGAELEQLSVADYLAYDEADSGVNWRVPDGYGALVAGATEGLPVALDTPIDRIDRTGAELVAEGPRGRLVARTIIVAVPTPALAREQLRFLPALPDKVEAAARLPLGFADKLFLHLDQPDEFEPDTQLMGRPGSAETAAHYLRPFGRPLIESFLGGAHARALEAAGEAAIADFAIEELAGLLGSSFRKRVHKLAGTGWGREARIGGSYSHALPGHAAARAALAAPVEDRIFFAGEACSPRDFSTAHGAHDTGVVAAEAAMRSLGRLDPSRSEASSAPA